MSELFCTFDTASLGVDKNCARLVVRFGRGNDMPRSLRRPLESVVEYGSFL